MAQTGKFSAAVTLSIDSLAPRGDGVGRAAEGGEECGTVYVDRAAPGDVVSAKVTSAPDGVLRGEILDILTPGPDRVAPPCPHYAVCGGCTLQHLSRAAQQAWKKETLVRTALARQGVTPARWLDPVFVPEATRRRATFAAFRQKDRVDLGYHARRSRRISDIEQCQVLDPAIMALRARMGAFLAPILKDSRPADVMVQKIGPATFDVVITGPVGRKGIPDLAVREAAARMLEGIGLSRLSWRADARDMPEILFALSPVVARFGAVAVELPPGAFLQPSAEGEAALVSAVMESLPETPKKGVFADLFAGCGTFAGQMAARGAVDAFESGGAAVEALARAGKAQGVQAFRRDLFREPLSPRELGRYAALVIDPPRAGARTQMEAIAQSAVPVVTSVSCNPMTFARDAAILCEGGYVFERAQIVDQFTFSHHVEMVGVFLR